MKINYYKLLFILSFLTVNLSCKQGLNQDALKPLNQDDLTLLEELRSYGNPDVQMFADKALNEMMMGSYTSCVIHGIIYNVGDTITVGGQPTLLWEIYNYFFIQDETKFMRIKGKTKKYKGRKMIIESINLNTSTSPKCYLISVTLKDVESSKIYVSDFQQSLLEQEIY